MKSIARSLRPYSQQITRFSQSSSHIATEKALGRKQKEEINSHMPDQMSDLSWTLLRVLLARSQVQDRSSISIESVQEQFACFSFGLDFICRNEVWLIRASLFIGPGVRGKYVYMCGRLVGLRESIGEVWERRVEHRAQNDSVGQIENEDRGEHGSKHTFERKRV